MSTAPNDIPIAFKDPAHEALMNVLWTGTLLKRSARTFFKKSPLSEAEFNLLLVLRHSPFDLTQNDLSERLLVDKSNITSLVDRLQKAKHIRRNPVKGDRRRYHITLTSGGCRLIDSLDPVYHQRVDEVMSGLSEREYKSLILLTRKLRKGLREAETTFSTEGGK